LTNVLSYEAAELLTRREEVSSEIRDRLQKRAQDFKLILDDVSITDLSFTTGFTKAVEAKQVAYQEAERQQFIVERAEQEKTAAIIRAEGESIAAEMISNAVAQYGSGLIEVRRIDTARQIADTLSHSRNVTYLPSSEGSNILMAINPN